MSATEPSSELLDEIRKVSPFDRLSERALAELASSGRTISVAPRQTLVEQHARGESVVIVSEGICKLVRGEILIEVVCGPSVVALGGALHGGPSLVAISAIRACKLIELPRALTIERLLAEPASAQAAAAIIASELAGMLIRVSELVGAPVEDRLASLLDRLAHKHGSAIDGGRFMALPLRRSELGAMVSATTESISRIMARWERLGAARTTKLGLWWRGRPGEALQRRGEKRAASPS